MQVPYLTKYVGSYVFWVKSNCQAEGYILKDLKFTQNSYAITYKAPPQFIDYFYHNLKTS